MESPEKKQTLIKDLSFRNCPPHITFPAGYFDGAAQAVTCGCVVWLGCTHKHRTVQIILVGEKAPTWEHKSSLYGAYYGLQGFLIFKAYKSLETHRLLSMTWMVLPQSPIHIYRAGILSYHPNTLPFSTSTGNTTTLQMLCRRSLFVLRWFWYISLRRLTTISLLRTTSLSTGADPWHCFSTLFGLFWTAFLLFSLILRTDTYSCFCFWLLWTTIWFLLLST